jgi:hypothetical protein
MTYKEYDPSKLWAKVTYDGEVLFEGTPKTLKLSFNGDVEYAEIHAEKQSFFARGDDYDTEKAIERMPEPARKLIRDYNAAVAEKENEGA